MLYQGDNLCILQLNATKFHVYKEIAWLPCRCRPVSSVRDRRNLELFSTLMSTKLSPYFPYVAVCLHRSQITTEI